MRNLKTVLFAVCVIALAGCGSTGDPGDPGDDRMSYDDAVRQIGRPPNRSTNAPDGSLEAIWETYARNETRQLILTFDSDRKLVSSRNAVLPRRR